LAIISFKNILLETSDSFQWDRILMLAFELANHILHTVWRPFVYQLYKEFNKMRGFYHEFFGCDSLIILLKGLYFFTLVQNWVKINVNIRCLNCFIVPLIFLWNVL
jgi:hypothetical protein